MASSSTPSLSSLVPLLQSREVLQQQQGVDGLEAWFAHVARSGRVLNAAEQAEVVSLLPLYEPTLRCANWKVNLGGLRCMRSHLQITHGASPGTAGLAAPLKQSWVQPLVDLLLEKLADQRAPIRLAAHEALLELHACAGYGSVWDRVAKALDAPQGHAHRAPAVRAGILGVFLALADAQGNLAAFTAPPGGTLRRLLDSTLRCIADPAPSVREQALCVLQILYMHVGDEILLRVSAAPPSLLLPAHTKLCYERLKDVELAPAHLRVGLAQVSAAAAPPPRQPALSSSVGREQASAAGQVAASAAPAVPASAALSKLKSRRMSSGGRASSFDSAALSARPDSTHVSPPREPSPSTSSAALTDAEYPLAPADDLKPLMLYEARQLDAEMMKVAEILKDIVTVGWLERMAAMRRVQQLLLGGAQHFDNFLPLLRSLRDPLCAQLSDLRSSVVREACVTLVLLGRTLGDLFEPFVEHFLPSLFKLLLVTIQVIKESANDCIRALLQSSPPRGGSAATAGSKYLAKILEGSAAANAILRLRCMEFVLLLLEVGVSSLIGEKHLASLQQCLLLRLADKNEEVRQKARQCACAYEGLGGTAAVAWVEKALDARTKKLVADERARYDAARFGPGAAATDAASSVTLAETHAPSRSRKSSRDLSAVSAAADSGSRTAPQAVLEEFDDREYRTHQEQQLQPDARDEPSRPLQLLRDAVRTSSRHVGPVRGTHAHSASADATNKHAASTMAATPQHHRSNTVAPASAVARRQSLGGGASALPGSDFSAMAQDDLSSSARVPRGRSRASGTPAGLAQSSRGQSATRTPAAASSSATPSAAPGSRARSASAVRSATPSLGGTTALHPGALPLSPSQAFHGIEHAEAPPQRRELLDAPLSHSQRSQLIVSLLDASADSLWSKRVHAFEQLTLIFNGGVDPASSAAASDVAAPSKRIPELFLLLDQITLALRAGLGDVHHRVVSQALLGCFALFTPLPSPQGQLSEQELRLPLERILPDIFALLSHAKLALRTHANSFLNHLATHFAPEMLCGMLVHRSLDAVHAVTGVVHPVKVRMGILEFLHYLLPLSGNYFRALTTLGGEATVTATQRNTAVVNAPLRALLSRMAPLLSSSADSSSAASREPALKKLCIQICQTLYLGFSDSFFPSLACLPVPQNRMIRKHLLETLPELEARIAEQGAAAGGGGANGAAPVGNASAAAAAASAGPHSQMHGGDADTSYDSPGASPARGAPAHNNHLAHSAPTASRTLDFSTVSQQQSAAPTPRQPGAGAGTSNQPSSSHGYEHSAPHDHEYSSSARSAPPSRAAVPAPVLVDSGRSSHAPPQREYAHSVHSAGDDSDAESGVSDYPADAASARSRGATRARSQSVPRSLVVDSALDGRTAGAAASSTDSSTFTAAYLATLLQSVSARNPHPASRQAAFVQLLAYACSTHTVWAPYFERVLLALLDIATSEADARGSDDDASTEPDQPGSAGTMVAASLGVLEALLQNHAVQFDANQGDNRYLELVLRTMLQVLRSVPSVSRTSSSGPLSPRSAASHALSTQAASVFTLASNLSPPPLLMRLLLHVLSTEQVHEGVLKLCLQRLARLIDERVDGATLMGSAADFGLQGSSLPSPSSSLLACIVHALSLCTHSSVLVRKLVISAFVRLYARVGGLLLPALDGLPALLVKLVHIYIAKFDAQHKGQV